MSLTNDDLNKISRYFDARFDILDSKIDNLRAYMDRRFSDVDDRLERVERKIDQLIKTEEEDILVAYKEIEVLKKRLTRVEAKLELTTK
jgi:tetrahydromethanopterin S-methyltransferase subunit G